MPPATTTQRTHQQLKAWRERILRRGGGSIAERRQFNAALRSFQLRAGGGGGLLDAVKRGNTRRVRTLIKSGADTNQENDDGETPLWLASHSGKTAMVKMLLAAGANTEAASTSYEYWKKDEPDGATPCWIAAQRGHAKVVKMLLAHGADPNAVAYYPSEDPEKYFNQHLDKWSYEWEEERKTALRRYVDEQKKNRTPWGTPCFVAVQQGHKAVLVALMNDDRTDPNKTTGTDGETPLLIAAEDGNSAIVAALLANRLTDVDKEETKYGMTPCFVAAMNGRVEVVQLLLARGADPNKATTDDGETPLMRAAKNGNASLVRLLLEHKADPNTAATDGSTPCSAAAKRGHEDVVQMMLAAGAEDCGWYRNLGKRIRGAFRQVADDSESVGDDLFG